MTVIAILLLAVVIALIVAAVTGSSDSVTIDAFNVSIDTTVAEVFLAGLLTGLLALAALVLLRAGMRRARQRRHEVRDLRRRAEAAPAVAERPADSDAATTSGTRDEPATHDAADASTTSADAADAAPDRPVTDQREPAPSGDGTDSTPEPHRS
jgi:C4-dicarboxylate-specific signal transduction histidine kinase